MFSLPFIFLSSFFYVCTFPYFVVLYCSSSFIIVLFLFTSTPSKTPLFKILLRIFQHKAAVGDLQSVNWNVCILRGTTVEIHPDHRRTWQSAPEEFSQAFDQLEQTHNKTYKDALTSVVKAPARLGDKGCALSRSKLG